MSFDKKFINNMVDTLDENKASVIARGYLTSGPDLVTSIQFFQLVSLDSKQVLLTHSNLISDSIPKGGLFSFKWLTIQVSMVKHYRYIKMCSSKNSVSHFLFVRWKTKALFTCHLIFLLSCWNCFWQQCQITSLVKTWSVSFIKHSFRKKLLC